MIPVAFRFQHLAPRRGCTPPVVNKFNKKSIKASLDRASQIRFGFRFEATDGAGPHQPISGSESISRLNLAVCEQKYGRVGAQFESIGG